VKTPPPRPSQEALLAAAVLEAHPVPTLVVDAAFRIAQVNAAARRLTGAREGASLTGLLSCTEPHPPGAGERCPGCAIHRSVARALAGEAVRERGFVLRSGARGKPADLHLLAFAAPLEREGGAHAILAVADANALLADPRVVRVCEGCGRIEDEEGHWHPLHRYLEDRLGLEAEGPLCDACSEGGAPASRR
jgi:PAS domain-containing protein